MIGRKLNTRLAELKMHSKEAMSKQRLQKLFEHERDKELERLGEISEAAKIFGRAGDVVDMELDLEAGWAYQLLAKFGTRVELSLEGDCIGLSYLLKNGVPVSHVDAIRINYRAERTTAVSASFEAGISRLMYHFEIEDTAINRQRAASKIFEGRAAALLEIDERHELVDKTLSEFTGGGRPASPAPRIPAVEVAAPVLDQTPSIPAEAEALPPPLAPAPPSEEAKPAYLDLTPRPAEPSKASVTPKSGAQRVVPVPDFEQECEKLIANMGNEWEPATGRDAMALVRIFKSVLIEHGVEHSGQIEQYHIGQLRQHFNHIPTDWGRSSRMRVMSAPELRAEGDRLKRLPAPCLALDQPSTRLAGRSPPSARRSCRTSRGRGSDSRPICRCRSVECREHLPRASSHRRSAPAGGVPCHLLARRGKHRTRTSVRAHAPGRSSRYTRRNPDHCN